MPQNGGRIIARAWVDRSYRERLLKDGRAAALELGFAMPEHHKQLVVLQNTPTVHNVMVCTLCSCTAFTIIGVAPGWYKDVEYRPRVVRESRTVHPLAERWMELEAADLMRPKAAWLYDQGGLVPPRPMRPSISAQRLDSGHVKPQ